MQIIYYHIIALFAGFLLDKLIGDPNWLPHPIVAFGNAIAFFEKRLNKPNNRIFKGAISSAFLIILTFVLVAFLTWFAYSVHPIFGCFVEGIFVFYGLAGTTLIKEGKAVFDALNDGGLEKGRQQVARIVGRDTNELGEEQIKKATLETLAENLSDGVVAPLFWYLILGAPGIMAYKMVNTLDSMIGYKNNRYLYYGRFAAKFDDFMNFIPARLTALIMAFVSLKKQTFQFILKYGKAHSSPNAGYPEAALAGILDVQFGGTHIYFKKPVVKPVIGENNRTINTSDLNKTIEVIQRVEIVMVVLLAALMFILNLPLIIG